MNSKSLGFRIILWSSLSSGIALFVFGIGAAINLYSEQLEGVDKVLAAHGKDFFSILHERRGNIDWENRDDLADLLGHDPDILGFALGGKNWTPTKFYPAEFKAVANSWRPGTKQNISATFGNRPVRLCYLEIDGQTLLLAADLTESQEVVQDLWVSYAICLPLVALLVGGGSWLVARRTLRPINEIAAAAERISTSSLHDRLPSTETNDEIGRLTRILNQMIQRLEIGFKQATRFTADAAHELRTPLTILRGQLEELIRTGQFTDSQESSLMGLLDETLRLQRISDKLLLLARFDAGKVRISTLSMDFSELLTEVSEDIKVLAESRKQAILLSIEPNVLVPGDTGLLQCVLFNLFENAVKYSPEGSLIEANLARSQSKAVFTIKNPGTPISVDQAANLFQRFSRPDTSRNRSNGGSGLGLSLCREIVLAHGGTIFLGNTKPGEISFLMSIPAYEV